jgi:hypothetical protein
MENQNVERSTFSGQVRPDKLAPKLKKLFHTKKPNE